MLTTSKDSAARRRTAALAILMLLVGTAGPAGGAASALAQQPPDRPGEAPTEPDAGSAFSREDLPPEGVRAQLRFGGFGGPGSCSFRVPGAPQSPEERSDCEVEVAESFVLELVGFAPYRYVDVEVARPDGAVVRDRIRGGERGVSGWQSCADPRCGVEAYRVGVGWVSLPDDPLGEYEVSATQGGRRASGTFTVRPAERPRVGVRPDAGPFGTTFRIAVAGFGPGALVPVRLYRTYWTYRPDGTVDDIFHQYVTTLGPLGMDERGQASYALRAEPSDPEGDYILDFEGREGPPPSITITGPELELGDESLETLARALVERANRVWASVVAKDGPPRAALRRVYGGDWLQEVGASVEAMQARGQYRVARPTGPVLVRAARALDATRFEAVVSEEWDDRLYNGDGSLARVYPGHVEQRYVLQLIGSDWLILESELVRSE